MLDLEKLEHEQDLWGYSVWSDDEAVYITRKGSALCQGSFAGCDRYTLARRWIAES